MGIAGKATTEGTARYKAKFESTTVPEHFRYQQGLWLSSVGVGTYLGKPDDSTDLRYREAVELAIRSGANVIDSAINYRYQRSERAIGTALKRLFDAGDFNRDEIIVCTKGGYVPFDSERPADPHAYIEDTFIRTGIVDRSDFAAGSHCMTPAYLKHQLGQSLVNLGLDCIDVYYIHNPESQLGEVPRDVFSARLLKAFETLESIRREGNINFYGVATWNGFRAQRSAPAYHSLAEMVALARQAGGENHGFRFIQLPINFGMTEALVADNQEVNRVWKSTIEAAEELGVTVISSASILQGKAARDLTDEVRAPLGSLSTDAQTAIQFVRSLPGVTTALVGMSSASHVRENLALASIRPATREDLQKLFQA